MWVFCDVHTGNLTEIFQATLKDDLYHVCLCIQLFFDVYILRLLSFCSVTASFSSSNLKHQRAAYLPSLRIPSLGDQNKMYEYNRCVSLNRTAFLFIRIASCVIASPTRRMTINRRPCLSCCWSTCLELASIFRHWLGYCSHFQASLEDVPLCEVSCLETENS